MESKSINKYIFLGTSVRYLMDVQEGWPVHGENYVLHGLEMVQEGLEEFGLTVSLRAFSGKFEHLLADLRGSPAGSLLTKAQAETVTSNMGQLLVNTIYPEGAGKVAFIATDKRHAVEKLLTGALTLLPDKVANELSPIARYDFEMGCRCIAFEVPTAAAFHLLRATEQTLRDFYATWVRQNRVKSLLWGPMVADMRKKTKRPETTVLDHLDHIRTNFRNPTDHPEKVYDVDEVQDLLGLCCDAISRMIQGRRL